MIENGPYISRLADCGGCHARTGGTPFAGGLPISTAFGTVTAPNITPDRESGIGGWSDEDFYRTMTDGIGRHGEYLYRHVLPVVHQDDAKRRPGSQGLLVLAEAGRTTWRSRLICAGRCSFGAHCIFQDGQPAAERLRSGYKAGHMTYKVHVDGYNWMLYKGEAHHGPRKSNAAPDINGIKRAGENLKAASVIAVDLDTGKPRWRFQARLVTRRQTKGGK
jgi:hypothetical protein